MFLESLVTLAIPLFFLFIFRISVSICVRAISSLATLGVLLLLRPIKKIIRVTGGSNHAVPSPIRRIRSVLVFLEFHPLFVYIPFAVIFSPIVKTDIPCKSVSHILVVRVF